MEKLNTIQTKEKLNEVFRLGEPGPGGAHHDYGIAKVEDLNGETGEIPMIAIIEFQKGPRSAQRARSGVLDTDLLEIVRDRLKAFQNGPYACEETQHALFLLEQSLIWMNRRVEDRIERRVLGTMDK